jgi:hypothetical protein
MMMKNKTFFFLLLIISITMKADLLYYKEVAA